MLFWVLLQNVLLGCVFFLYFISAELFQLLPLFFSRSEDLIGVQVYSWNCPLILPINVLERVFIKYSYLLTQHPLFPVRKNRHQRGVLLNLSRRGQTERVQVQLPGLCLSVKWTLSIFQPIPGINLLLNWFIVPHEYLLDSDEQVCASTFTPTTVWFFSSSVFASFNATAMRLGFWYREPNVTRIV